MESTLQIARWFSSGKFDLAAPYVSETVASKPEILVYSVSNRSFSSSLQSWYILIKQFFCGFLVHIYRALFPLINTWPTTLAKVYIRFKNIYISFWQSMLFLYKNPQILWCCIDFSPKNDGGLSTRGGHFHVNISALFFIIWSILGLLRHLFLTFI